MTRMTLRRFLSAMLLCGLAACSSAPSYPPAPDGFYRVQPGDTLYRIALNNKQSVGNLTRWNGLKDASSIEAGQLLRIRPPAATASASSGKQPPAPRKEAPTPAPSRKPPVAISLQWPAQGKLLSRYDGSRSKGIDIGGAAGSPVKAAADGKVAYAGKGIRAYGNLLNIKHNNDHLTAYAHNQNLLVKEGQSVKAGDTIATLGRTGATRDQLHFELRHQGQAIDPLPYLPAQ